MKKRIKIEDRVRILQAVDKIAHKLLESANIKLGIVATDILGASGQAMLRALMAGEGDGTVLAELAKGALRQKRGWPVRQRERSEALVYLADPG